MMSRALPAGIVCMRCSAPKRSDTERILRPDLDLREPDPSPKVGR